MSDVEQLLKKLEREQRARREAESLLEAKSRELYISNEELRCLNEALEEQVQRRVSELIEAQAISQLESKERKRLGMIVEGLPNAMIMVDETRRIALVNAQTENLFGYTREELIGQPVEILVPSCFRTHHPGSVTSYMEKHNPRSMGAGRDLYGVRKDGGEVPIEIGLNPIRTADGLMVLASVVDITERKRMEEQMKALNVELSENARQLETVNERLRHANKAKGEFLAAMSHELRTPLNGILGMNELLRATDLDERQRKYVEASSSSGKLLVQLINDVLDLSKIEAGKLDIHRVKCDIESLVYDVAEIMAHAAHQKGLALKCCLAPETAIFGLCDDNRLRQILVNLVGNAIKFTSTGSVTIECARISDQDKIPWLRFSVRDTGIGVPKDRRHRLFKAFSQIDYSTTRRYGGTGLGLSICKQLVELMGGRIGVSSEVGRGSIFWFEIPIEIVATTGLERRIQLMDGIRVLVINGLGDQQEQLGNSLSTWGCHLLYASNASEGVVTAKQAEDARNPVTAVLAPSRIANGEDYNALRQLSELPELHIIALSGADEEVDHECLQALGISHVLREPVRPSTLFDTICSVRAIRNVAASDNGHADPLLPHAKFSGHILVAEDNRINQLYIAELLKNLGCTIELTSNGGEALAAVEKGIYDLVLMDCQMPEMDGYTASREIRKREAAGQLSGHLPIIALTANALAGDREKCIEAGMDEYIRKPLAAEEICRALVEFLPEQSALPQLQAESV